MKAGARFLLLSQRRRPMLYKFCGSVKGFTNSSSTPPPPESVTEIQPSMVSFDLLPTIQNIDASPPPIISPSQVLPSRSRDVVSEQRAREFYFLTAADLSLCEKVAGGYLKSQIESAAFRKFGSPELLDIERERRKSEKTKPKPNQWQWLEELKSSRKNRKASVLLSFAEQQTQTWKGSQRTVTVALSANILVMAGKFFGFAVTGSGVMLAEAFHSVADVINQLFLSIGIRRSLKKPDALHPYGYGPEAYVWALISGVGVFFVGCGASIYHGISCLLHPHPIVAVPVALTVLGWSFVLETYSLYVAWKESKISAKKQKMNIWEYIKTGPDPMNVAVLLEDFAAVTGLAIASGALLIGHYITPESLQLLDSAGSMVVGCLLGGFASFLVKKNKDYLTSRSITPQQLEKILDVLKAEPIIKEVAQVKAINLGPETISFKADIRLNGEKVSRRYIQQRMNINTAFEQVSAFRTPYQLEEFIHLHGDGLIDFVGDEIDRIERRIQQKMPQVLFIELEIM